MHPTGTTDTAAADVTGCPLGVRCESCGAEQAGMAVATVTTDLGCCA